MFTIKHYFSNGYATIEAEGYRVEEDGGIVQVYFWKNDEEMKAPRSPDRCLSLCTSDSHAYVSNVEGVTVDHIRPSLRAPKDPGYPESVGVRVDGFR